MDNQSYAYPESTGQPGNAATQESIFTDLTDISVYDKNLRTARIWLFVIAGIQFLVGIYEFATIADSHVGGIAFGIDAFIALVFFSLSLWSKKNPVPAFLTALVFYISVIAIFMYFDPSSIAKGIVIKVLVIIALIKAYRDAKENEELKASINA